MSNAAPKAAAVAIIRARADHFELEQAAIQCPDTNEGLAMQPTVESETIEHLSPIATRMILAALPIAIREAFERRTAEIEYPVKAVLEMVLAGFLDSECLSFSDCKPRY